MYECGVDDTDPPRPRTHGDCLEAGYGEPLFPCPWLTCRHHVAIYHDREGLPQIEPIAIGPDGEVDLLLLEQTCSLRVADAGEHTHDEVGLMLGITREGVRQMVLRASKKMAQRLSLERIDDDPQWQVVVPKNRRGQNVGDHVYYYDPEEP